MLRFLPVSRIAANQLYKPIKQAKGVFTHRHHPMTSCP